MEEVTQTCNRCGRKFLVIKQEREFLDKKGLPLPTTCPTDRQINRIKNRGERQLYKTTCQECGNNVVTSYDPQKAKSKILCQKCFADFFDKNEATLA